MTNTVQTRQNEIFETSFFNVKDFVVLSTRVGLPTFLSFEVQRMTMPQRSIRDFANGIQRHYERVEYILVDSQTRKMVVDDLETTVFYAKESDGEIYYEFQGLNGQTYQISKGHFDALSGRNRIVRQMRSAGLGVPDVNIEELSTQQLFDNYEHMKTNLQYELLYRPQQVEAFFKADSQTALADMNDKFSHEDVFLKGLYERVYDAGSFIAEMIGESTFAQFLTDKTHYKLVVNGKYEEEFDDETKIQIIGERDGDPFIYILFKTAEGTYLIRPIQTNEGNGE